MSRLQPNTYNYLNCYCTKLNIGVLMKLLTNNKQFSEKLSNSLHMYMYNSKNYYYEDLKDLLSKV